MTGFGLRQDTGSESTLPGFETYRIAPDHAISISPLLLKILERPLAKCILVSPTSMRGSYSGAQSCCLKGCLTLMAQVRRQSVER